MLRSGVLLSSLTVCLFACDDGGGGEADDAGASRERRRLDVGAAPDSGSTGVDASSAEDAERPVDAARMRDAASALDAGPAPDASELDAEAPDAAESDGEAPDAAPDSEASDSALSDSDAPDSALPDSEAPDADASEDAEPVADLGPVGELDTLIVEGPADPGNDPRPTFTFRSPRARATFECRLLDEAWAPCASPHTVGLLEEDRVWRFAVRAVDGAEVDPSPAEVEFLLDTVAPQVALEGGPPDPSPERSADFAVAVAEAEEVECRLDGQPVTPCPGALALRRLGEGARSFEVIARDAAGNEARAAHDWTIARETTLGDGPAVRDFGFALVPTRSSATDAEGRLHLAYGTDRLLYRSGPPWDAPPEVVHETPIRDEKALAIGPDGRPHVVYLDLSTYSLRYAHRSAEGWQVEDTGLIADFKARRFGLDAVEIAVTADGRPHLLYYLQDAGRNTQHAWREEGGWRVGEFLPGNANDEQLALSVAPDGRLWGAVCDDRAGGEWWKVAALDPQDIEAGWSPVEVPAPAAFCRGFAQPARISFDAEGRLWALLNDFVSMRGAGDAGWVFRPLEDTFEPVGAVFRRDPLAPVAWQVSLDDEIQRRFHRTTWDADLRPQTEATNVVLPGGTAARTLTPHWLPDGTPLAVVGGATAINTYTFREAGIETTEVDTGWTLGFEEAFWVPRVEGPPAFVAAVAGSALGGAGPRLFGHSDGAWVPAGGLGAGVFVGEDGRLYERRSGNRNWSVATVDAGPFEQWVFGRGLVASEVHVGPGGRLALLQTDPLQVLEATPDGAAPLGALAEVLAPQANCSHRLDGPVGEGLVLARICPQPARVEVLTFDGETWIPLFESERGGVLPSLSRAAGRIAVGFCDRSGDEPTHTVVHWWGEAVGVEVFGVDEPERFPECRTSQVAISADGRLHALSAIIRKTEHPLEDPFGNRVDARKLRLHTETREGWRIEVLGDVEGAALLGLDAQGHSWTLWRDQRQRRLRSAHR